MRGHLFVGIDLCGDRGLGTPAAPQCLDEDGARRGRRPRGGDARGDPRPEQPRRWAHAAVPFR